jgi:hypothetical protein
MKMALKLKINPIREYLRLIIHSTKPTKDLFLLIKSRETIPLRPQGEARTLRTCCHDDLQLRKGQIWREKIPAFAENQFSPCGFRLRFGTARCYCFYLCFPKV